MSLEHWETYYRGGALATCPTGPHGGYDLELGTTWTEFFSPLPEGATLLDLGTGNGAVVILALQVARSLGRGWSIHGVDLARIDPVRDVPGGDVLFAGVRFHPGVAMETLPFQDGSVDAVSGHYALEYADMAKALHEVHRVLKPGGRARFVVHHSESVLVDNARASLRQAHLVLKEARVYRHLKALVSMEGRPRAEIDDAARALRDAIGMLKQARSAATAPGQSLVLDATLDAVKQLLAERNRVGPAVGREVERVEKELRSSVRRLNDLCERALDRAGVDALADSARAIGFTDAEVDTQFHRGSNLVGWRMTLTRT